MTFFSKNQPTILLTVILLLGSIISGGFQFADFTNTKLIQNVHAQDTYEFLAPIGGMGDEIDVSSENSFPNYVRDGISLLIGFAIMASIVVIIAAGFTYLTSTSQSGTTQAKSMISNAIIGLVLALAAVLILQTINPNLIRLDAIDTVTTTGSTFSTEENNNEND